MNKNKPYTSEEIQYIREHYRQDGYVAVAHHLGRTTASIRNMACRLGVTLRYRQKPVILEHEAPRGKQHKADVTKNGDEDTLKQLMSQKAVDDKDKVMLKVKRGTWVMVPRQLATPEYAEYLRQRYYENEKKHYG